MANGWFRTTARRYSGDVRVQVTYMRPSYFYDDDGECIRRDGQYYCAVTLHGRPRHEVWVTLPVEFEHPVDSSEAFDAAARCAIEFADHEHPDAGIHEACDVSEDGLIVSRARRTTRPRAGASTDVG